MRMVWHGDMPLGIFAEIGKFTGLVLGGDPALSAKFARCCDRSEMSMAAALILNGRRHSPSSPTAIHPIHHI